MATTSQLEKIAVERQIPKTASGIGIPRQANAEYGEQGEDASFPKVSVGFPGWGQNRLAYTTYRPLYRVSFFALWVIYDP